MSGVVMSSHGPVQLGAFSETLSYPGKYLNDHCLFLDGEVWHFFGIIGPVGRGCYDDGSECSFAHATSPDLRQWTIHPDVLPVTGAGCDSGHVFAPHVIAHDGTYWMLYTGIDAKGCQRICLATSRDLFQWERYSGNPIIVPSLTWASWPGYSAAENAIGNCRDTHVARLSDGRFVAYWVAELNERAGKDEGAIVASVSDDLIHWLEYGPIFTMRHWPHPPTRAVESPCMVEKDGRFWLFFKHGWWTYVTNAPTPFDFRNRPAMRLGFAHAAEVFHWNGRWHITHCSADPTDYEYRQSNRTRGLFLGELDWPENGFPSLLPRTT